MKHIYWWIINVFKIIACLGNHLLKLNYFDRIWYIHMGFIEKQGIGYVTGYRNNWIRLERTPVIERLFSNGIWYYIDTNVEHFYLLKTEKSENHLVFFIYNIMFCFWITYKHLLPLWRIGFRCKIFSECIEKWISWWRIAVVLIRNKRKKTSKMFVAIEIRENIIYKDRSQNGRYNMYF